ncbi:HlyD family type I secretion periplasmic adaptor subunit [Microvirga sp. TS319]|uniref:HlyD family type I secretion periplasmic adaptor subunit n=1 Tax=Microvirga sp. TS319 TaxID=3241165 RepID=UPI003519EB3A
MRRYLLLGTATACMLVFGVGGWAATTELAGAVIAPSVLVVDSNVKKVQHPTGGVVDVLRVRDGDRVQAGDLLVRLDETVTQANLAVVQKDLTELSARRAREEAERDGEEAIVFPADLLAQRSDPEVALVITGEERLFAMRRAAREGQKSQLKERIGQLKEEMQGLSEQISAKDSEIQLIGQELKGVRELWQKNLVPLTRVTALERDGARLGGERGALVAALAQAKGKISETELQILQVDQDLRAEVGRDLAEVRAKISELVEKRVAAQDQLKRVDIRSPQDGIVHQLSIHTVGGVVTAGEPIMLIVPEGDALTVEAKIAPQDIDQVRIGHKAVLRFTAFSRRTTPELNGEVSRISADISQDEKTGTSFYTVRIALPQSEIDRLKGLRLVPGMPVESFIQTGERTVVSYLTKPLRDQLMKAWREN